MKNSSNPYPQLTPNDLWIAKQKWLTCSNPERKQALEKTYKTLRGSYATDENGAFLKDKKGMFVKLENNIS